MELLKSNFLYLFRCQLLRMKQVFSAIRNRTNATCNRNCARIFLSYS